MEVSKSMGQVLTVQRQLFLCLRALVARMPFARLRPFLPFVLTEMASAAAAPAADFAQMRAFERGRPVEAAYEACKLLDLLLLTQPHALLA